ncbi:MAG: response regulator [Magnetococcales bacterium]|nr:response regulator [Magnetococcales bacterium]
MFPESPHSGRISTTKVPLSNGVSPVRGLLVEDDVGFAGLLEEWLNDLDHRSSPMAPFHLTLTRVDNLSMALQALAMDPFDILLVDLNLPDSVGLETFERICGPACNHPVIVLSGLDDESLAIQAVRSGAQDYLVKNTLDGNLLFRSVRHALERHALNQALERVREEDRRQREQGSLERLSERNISRITSQMLGIVELKRGYPEIFSRMVLRLGTLVEKQLQMRTHKIHYNISDELKEIAAEMGFLRCGPRDVVDVYMATMELRENPENQLRNEAMHEECRYLAFELMGRLVAFYRPYALGGEG